MLIRTPVAAGKRQKALLRCLREHKPAVGAARADLAAVDRVARTLLRRGYTLGMPRSKRKAAAKGREVGSRKAVCVGVEQGSTLVAGQRLRVYWPKERSWFFGTVSGSTVFEDGVLISQVRYDDGDVQWHDLRPQATRWSITDAGGDSLPLAPPGLNISLSGASSAAPPDGRHDVGGDTPSSSAGGHAQGTSATTQQPDADSWAHVLSQSGVGVADGDPTSPIGFEVGSNVEGMDSDALTPLQRRRTRNAATQRRSRAAAMAAPDAARKSPPANVQLSCGAHMCSQPYRASCDRVGSEAELGSENR